MKFKIFCAGDTSVQKGLFWGTSYKNISQAKVVDYDCRLILVICLLRSTYKLLLTIDIISVISNGVHCCCNY